MSDVTQKHPSIGAAILSDWALCSAAYEGESVVKSRGEDYLPRPSGFVAGADLPIEAANKLYQSYKERAQFPEIMGPSVGAMVGIIHGTEIVPDLPDAMTYLVEDIDGEGTTLTDFHKQITRSLLVLGRYGVLADVAEVGGDPYLVGYAGPQLINWDTGFFVLDETHWARTDFTWNEVNQHRVLEMEEGALKVSIHTDGAVSIVTPTRQGGGAIDFMPFHVASAKDMGPSIETPPLRGVASASKRYYCLSADQSLQLHMSGQETLFVYGADAPEVVGAGIVAGLKGDGEEQVSAEYVGPSCSGIDAHQRSMEHQERVAVQSGARMFEQSEQANESGKARQMRFRSETANLQSIAALSCSLLEAALRSAAQFKGLDRESVTVEAPKDLLDASLTPADASALWGIVKERGLSMQTYYELIQKGGIASGERNLDEEISLIEGRDVGLIGGDEGAAL